VTGRPGAAIIVALVVVGAFLLGYFLPDLTGSTAGEPTALPPASLATRTTFASHTAVPTAPLSAATFVPTPAPAASPTTVRPPAATIPPTATSAAPIVTPTPPAPAVSPSAGPGTPAAAPTAERAPATPTAQPTATPAQARRIHVVEQGDNLWDLARRYNVSVEAIVAANGLAKPEALALGQKLIIPPPEQ